ALKQSSTVLDQGDLPRAQTVLAGMKSSAEALHVTAQQFADRAADIEKLRESEAREVATHITKTYKAEQDAEKEMRDLQGKIADSSKQLEKANATRRELDVQLAVYHREVEIRADCKSHFAEGIFHSWDCWRLSFQDVFANRVT